MRFVYTYRSSDGQRHTAEIEAESRDAAFAKVRAELGVKPIRVTAAEGPDRRQDGASPKMATKGGAGRAANVSAAPRGGTWRAAVLAAMALAAAGAWLWLRRAGNGAPYQVMTPQGPVTYAVAQPLPRQAIPGDRKRIEQAGDGVFRHAAERWLARYAEPGRAAGGASAGHAPKGVAEPRRPADADFEAALREPVRVASTDFTEVVDLKRIVAGMKREMRAYLAGGGALDGYLAELEKRQRLEISYRERAEQRLGELLAAGGRDAQDAAKAAYAYWLKANAQLQAMGIWPLPLPDQLRAYQMGMDMDE